MNVHHLNLKGLVNKRKKQTERKKITEPTGRQNTTQFEVLKQSMKNEKKFSHLTLLNWLTI